jgi:L-2-hydroxyglutarate oxidase
VPQTGIIDYTGVTNAYADIVMEHGGEIRTNSRVWGFDTDHDGFFLSTVSGDIRARNIINCAGLQSDRVARMCGVEPGLQIMPFRGEYYELVRGNGIC